MNGFFIGKSAEKRRHNETESTTEEKDGDNSDNSSDQNTKHVPDINKQSLIFPEE